MHLTDYFAGKCLRLHSPTSARIVAERVNEAAGSALWPFTMGVVGGVWSGHVRLRFRSSLFEYNAKPVLAGRLKEAPRGSSLDLRYRAPAWVYAFDLFWYSSLGLVVLIMLGQVGERNPDLNGRDLTIVSAGLVVLLLFPIVLHYFGTRNSDEELSYLLDFLAEHADATP